jgi:L-threonylcarbamoyladenylate synthase
MLTYTISATRPDSKVIAAAADILRVGGVVAYATDTLYGLAVDPRQDEAVARLFDVKGRQERQAIPLIAASLEQAQAVGEFSEPEVRLAREFWPGPLTIVVPARSGLSSRVLAGGLTIGIRVPAHAVARALAGELGSPITSTSANRSGGAAPASASALDSEIARRIDAVIDSGPAPGGEPSTIVTMTSGELQLLRAGAIAWDRVLRSATRR